MSSDLYDTHFYQRRRQATLHAARRILGLVHAQTSFRSAVDFGCGTGTWLSVAKELGAERVRGYEGLWLKAEWLDEPGLNVRPVALDQPLPEVGSYDLAISLEVAEHLPAPRAESFVAELCAAAPNILFSAAPPGQTGDGHVNERWPDYWVTLFAAKGYGLRDVIRQHVWDDAEIPYWYRQNCLLFVRGAAEMRTGPLNIVHPEQFMALQKRQEDLSVRALLAAAFRRVWI
ncbi:MAG: class I SAM-dependent methyltransferase [Pseudomonadota bacterium]